MAHLPLWPNTPRSSLPSVILVPTRTQCICALGLSVICVGLDIAAPFVAPTQRSARVSAFICFRAMQQCIFILLLVAAVFGQSVFGVAPACFDLGGPGVVFCSLAGDMVWIRRFGLVGKDAFAKELVEVVA